MAQDQQLKLEQLLALMREASAPLSSPAAQTLKNSPGGVTDEEIDAMRNENELLQQMCASMVDMVASINADTNKVIAENEDMVKTLSREMGPAAHKFAPMVSEVQRSTQDHAAERAQWNQRIAHLEKNLARSDMNTKPSKTTRSVKPVTSAVARPSAAAEQPSHPNLCEGHDDPEVFETRTMPPATQSSKKRNRRKKKSSRPEI